MDRRMLEGHLALAEGHVASGEQHVANQRRRIATLKADGHDTTGAKELLVILEQSQALHVADRDRLASELATTAGDAHATRK